jgi:hypothetical protein
MKTNVGKWTVNWKNPVSLDYTNPRFGYRGDSNTGTAYWVRLTDIDTPEGLQAKVRHLSGKVWFNHTDFMNAANEAFEHQTRREQ